MLESVCRRLIPDALRCSRSPWCSQILSDVLGYFQMLSNTFRCSWVPLGMLLDTFRYSQILIQMFSEKELKQNRSYLGLMGAPSPSQNVGPIDVLGEEACSRLVCSVAMRLSKILLIATQLVAIQLVKAQLIQMSQCNLPGIFPPDSQWKVFSEKQDHEEPMCCGSIGRNTLDALLKSAGIPGRYSYCSYFLLVLYTRTLSTSYVQTHSYSPSTLSLALLLVS